MTTVIISEEPSDTDAVLSSIKHDMGWLIELSNNDPNSFIGREAELYSAMNALQLVTSRFVRPVPKAATRR
jgi:hypothetical protein